MENILHDAALKIYSVQAYFHHFHLFNSLSRMIPLTMADSHQDNGAYLRSSPRLK